MGDDAEYYIEQQEAEARYEQACRQAELDRNKKSLYCWVDGCDQDIWWDWEPMIRVPGVFEKLHNLKNIGSEYFLASCLPDQDHEEDEYDEDYADSIEIENSKDIKVIDGLEYIIVSNESEASSEVLTLSQKDTNPLKAEAIRQKESANNLKDQIISEMLEYMISFIESNPNCDKFIFAREI